MAERIASMHELALRMATFGKEFIIADVTLFVTTGLFLVIQMIRGGKVGNDQGHAVTTSDLMGNTDSAMRGISKQKVFYSRTKFVTMASLVKGTASKQDWYFVIGFNLAIMPFVCIFLGVGLTLLPDGEDLAFNPLGLLFAAFPFVTIPILIKGQYKDYKKTQEKLNHKRTVGRNGP
jgi:hypothetical protein